MEDAQATTEEIFYGNLPQTRIGLPTGYPPNSPTGNQRVARVTGTIWGGMKIGPAIALKVMAGDKFNVQVNSWYKLAKGQTIPAPSGIITELLAALNNAVGGISGPKATPTDLNSSGILLPGVNNFITNQGNSSSNTAPRAYLNWILFDEQFNYVSSNSGFEQVPEETYYNNDNIPNNNTKLHVFNDLPISKSGFLYIYVSNETPNIDVLFDNLQVTHIRGQILETNEFYAGGLIQSGISYKAAGVLENKKSKFNGYELNTDFDVNIYESFYRIHDQQLGGRFWQVDPSPTYAESPYAAMGNNPVLNIDILGDTLNIGDLQNNSSALAKELQNNFTTQTGLILSYANGNVSYKTIKENGKIYPVVDGSIKSSPTARGELMKAIDKNQIVTVVDRPGNPLGSHVVGNVIVLDSKAIYKLIDGTTNMNKNTMGAGITFFHEYGHTQSGGERSDPGYGGIKWSNRDRIGRNETIINNIRKELGPDYGQRMSYFYDQIGGSKYLPFDKAADDQIRHGFAPPSNSKFIKF